MVAYGLLERYLKGNCLPYGNEKSTTENDYNNFASLWCSRFFKYLLKMGKIICLSFVAALVLSANPKLSAAEVKEILQTTADKIVDTDPDIVLSTNRGQYDTNGRCDWFGFGKVNAATAVVEAKKRMNNF